MSTPTPQPVNARPDRTRVKDARRIAIIATIGFLCLAAVVGIVALLTGAFGVSEGRILLTTLAAAGFTTAALCHLAVTGPKAPPFWIVGIGVSALALLSGLILIWTEWSNFSSIEWLVKSFGVLTVLSVSLAHMNLLLAIGVRRNRSLSFTYSLIATHTAILSLAMLLISPIIDYHVLDNSPNYWRLVGVVAIIDLLGSIVIPIMVRLTRAPALTPSQPPAASLAG